MQKEILSLTISTDDGRLFVILTDSKRLSRHGWARTDLLNIRNVAAAVEPAVLQELIFPVSVNQAIENSDAAILLVHIQPELAFIPIEAFQSTGQRWCEKFAMAFYLPSLELTDAPSHRTTNSVHEQIHISFTTKLFNQDHAFLLANQLTKNGLLVASPDTLRNSSTVLIACSAIDATRHIRSIADSTPEMCIWPIDSLPATLGIQVAEFNTEFPACAVLTGRNFETVEDIVSGLIPALCMLNAGLTPLDAVQYALQRNDNRNRTLRLYNCDDIALCQPRSIAQLESENRTITALSLDVVASTQMMHRLGNERYSEVLATLKERCIKCIHDRGGSSGGRAGDDSTMAYFGLPNALENTAGRAMDTALAVRSILPSLPGQPQLRIGIATGRVAVRSGVPYGEAIHLAARLQAHGQPGDIIVDTASQWLARREYVFEPCGDYTVFRGIDHPVLPLKLIAFAREKSPNTGVGHSAPFIGRDSEMMQLANYWQRVSQGEQLVVCVQGEAGIGKSRLVREFLAIALPDEGRLLKIRGLSDYQGGVFYSLKESLRRGFGIQPGDPPSQIRERIQEVASLPLITVQNLAYVAELLGITEIEMAQTNNLQSLTNHDELSVRESLFELLTEAIYVAACDKPLVLMVDDLQWVDPSTREALEHVINVLSSCNNLRLLVLCTVRDGQVSPALPDTETLMLNRLTLPVAQNFIRNIVGEKLPAEAVDRLVARAEGVPLFLEESARLALDRSAGSSNPIFSVPDSIDSLLMSRLDNLDKSGKYLVQVASVIGRDVPIDLLRLVVNGLTSSFSAIDFKRQIESFSELGVLSDLKAKGTPRLTFRHEMIRDVAYMSMWQRDRITVHAAVAQVILNDQARMFVGQPGMIAHHLTLSEQHEQAATQWEKAARIAADASANQEAIHNLRSALLSLEHFTNNEQTDKQEMRLQLMLAARLIASEGYGAEEVRIAYERAQLLVRRVGDKRYQLKVTLGLESVHVMRGELRKAEELAAAAVEIADELTDLKIRIPMLIQSRWALGNIRFHQGHSRAALALMDRCLKDCRSISHKPIAVQDPEIMCLCYGAWALWEQGFSDTAYERAAQAVDLAKSRGHRFSEAEALGFYASLALFRGEFDTAITFADNAITICEQEKFAIWLAHARVIRGRAIALTGNRTEAVAQMEQGYKEWVCTGAVITRAFYLSLIAETLLEAGELDSAIEKIHEAGEIIARTGDQYHLAEVLRIQGLIAYAKDELRTGDSLMHQAIEIAHSQEKQAFVLRASTAMAKSLASKECYEDAIRAVEEALSPIHEGLSTHDPTHAQALISTWAAMHKSAVDPIQSKPTTDTVSQRSCVIPFPQSVND